MREPAAELKRVMLVVCPVELTILDYTKAFRKDGMEIFTGEPLTDQQLNLIFSEYTDHTAIDWMAYPEYVTPESFLVPLSLTTDCFKSTVLNILPVQLEAKMSPCW